MSGISAIIGVIAFVTGVAGVVYASYIVLKAKRSTILANQQGQANQALSDELSAYKSKAERLEGDISHIQDLMVEKQRQIDQSAKQIEELFGRLSQKAEVGALSDKVDLILVGQGEILKQVGIIK